MGVRRLSQALAFLGLVAALIGAARIGRVFGVHTATWPGLTDIWVLSSIALSVFAIGAVSTASVALVWATVGAVCGLIILGALSIGPFFFWEGCALLTAGLVHLGSVEPPWKRVLAPLWFIAGACSVCVALLAPHLTRTPSAGTGVSVAPAVIFGSWLAAASVSLLWACYIGPLVWRERRSRAAWKTAVMAVGVLALLTGAFGLARAGGRALRVRGSACWSTGGAAACSPVE